MIRRIWLLLGLVSVGAIAAHQEFAPFLITPAHACTPHLDNPSGCDRINHRFNVPVVKGSGDGDPWPPNCPQCRQVIFDHREELVLPTGQIPRQGNFRPQMLNPQPLPPKAGQILR